MSHKDLSQVQSCSIGSITISDHAPILIKLILPAEESGKCNWRLNESLLKEPKIVTELKAEIEFFFEVNMTPESNPMMVWEAHKTYIRGLLIKQGSKRKKERMTQISKVLNEIAEIEAIHKSSQSELALAKLTNLREQLKDIYNTQVKAQMNRCKAVFYSQGDKCGKVLARALKEQQERSFIPEIKNERGVTQILTPKIAEAFRQYYSSLYNLNSNLTQEQRQTMENKIQLYLDKAAMPCLSSEMVDILEAPITKEELLGAISQTKNGKAPGPDGYTIGYYKKMQESLLPYFLKAYNEAGEKGELPVDSTRAIISLIPKEGKDLTLCSSYRPISLLNVDLKLFTKILANRLSRFIPNLIHSDQVGFIPGREARDNTTRVIDLVHRAEKKKISLCLLSTDAEKAFDRVGWPFMMAALRSIGCGERFLTWIRAIYSKPKAQVRVNGQSSQYFDISNGTRQGCPLSPLIFALSLEPFLRIIRSNLDISGMRVGDSGEHKVAAYADDLIFFITRPHITLPCLLAEFREYGFISNLKINWQKSEALNITTPKDQQQMLEKNFSFRWAENDIVYLGIQITRSVTQLYKANFLPLLTRLKQDLIRWNRGLFSWFGRNNIVKMNILPRVLYLFQTLPIHIPKLFFKTMENLVRNFIWKGKTARIARPILQLPKERGGIALPDFDRYYAAVHLTRMIDWFHQRPQKRWVALEQAAIGVNLSVLPWCRKELPVEIRSHPTVGATLAVGATKLQMERVSPSPSPLYAITGNPDFPPACMDPKMILEVEEQPLRVIDLKDINSWSTLDDIQRQSCFKNCSIWQKQQLMGFFRSLPELERFRRPLTQFEIMCRKKGELKHVISSVYSMLLQPMEGTMLPFIQKWEQELGVKWTPTQIDAILEMTWETSPSIKYQEMSYKIMTRWYYTPLRLRKMFPNSQDICWRCQQEVGSLLHIFWQCTALEKYWRAIAQIIQKFTTKKVELDPAFFLLHMDCPRGLKSKKSILPCLLNVAKSLIPVLWKSTTEPTLKMWIMKVNEISRMEELMADNMGTQEIWANKWRSWQEFRGTGEYLGLLGGASPPGIIVGV